MRVSAVLVMLMVCVVGCGVEASPGRESAHDGASAVYRSFADCMRREGANVGVPVIHGDGSIEIPPGDGAGLSSEEELRVAAEACQPILSARGLPSPGPITLDEQAMEEIKSQSVAFAACLRRSGIHWPDPQWDGGAIVNWHDVGVDLDDAATKAIGESCVIETGFDPLLAHAIDDDG